MNDLVGMIFVLLVAFFIAVIIAVPIINFIKSKKVNQPIYEYVEKHNLKAGTPTMGGLVFIITFILVSIFFINGFVKHIYSAILFALLNACVGIYDDILKKYIGEVSYYFEEEYREYVLNIIVEAKYRHLGKGKEALELLCQQAKENGLRFLCDDIETNNPAKNLFLDLGFKEVWARENITMLKKRL